MQGRLYAPVVRQNHAFPLALSPQRLRACATVVASVRQQLLSNASLLCLCCFACVTMLSVWELADICAGQRRKWIAASQRRAKDAKEKTLFPEVQVAAWDDRYYNMAEFRAYYGHDLGRQIIKERLRSECNMYEPVARCKIPAPHAFVRSIADLHYPSAHFLEVSSAMKPNRIARAMLYNFALHILVANERATGKRYDRALNKLLVLRIVLEHVHAWDTDEAFYLDMKIRSFMKGRSTKGSLPFPFCEKLFL